MPSTLPLTGETNSLLLIDRGADGAPVGSSTRRYAAPMTALGVPTRSAGARSPDPRAARGPPQIRARRRPRRTRSRRRRTRTRGRPDVRPHADADRAARLRPPLHGLRGPAGRHGLHTGARGRAPIAPAEVPALAAATSTLSKLIVHEKVETAARAVRRGAAWRPPPARPAAPPRGRRAVHVHALHGRADRAGARRAAPARAGDRAHGQHRARRVGGQRLPHAGLLDLRPREHAGARGRAAHAEGALRGWPARRLGGGPE